MEVRVLFRALSFGNQRVPTSKESGFFVSDPAVCIYCALILRAYQSWAAAFHCNQQVSCAWHYPNSAGLYSDPWLAPRRRHFPASIPSYHAELQIVFATSAADELRCFGSLHSNLGHDQRYSRSSFSTRGDNLPPHLASAALNVVSSIDTDVLILVCPDGLPAPGRAPPLFE